MSTSRELEFIVGVIDERSGSLWIGGRCSKGPIRIGDAFDIAYRYAPPAITLGDYGRPAQRTDEKPISLLVTEIITYGHKVDELDVGLTAELKVLAELDPALLQGDVLGKSGYIENDEL